MQDVSLITTFGMLVPRRENDPFRRVSREQRSLMCYGCLSYSYVNVTILGHNSRTSSSLLSY